MPNVAGVAIGWAAGTVRRVLNVLTAASSPKAFNAACNRCEVEDAASKKAAKCSNVQNAQLSALSQ
jgi:hypothetical protein